MPNIKPVSDLRNYYDVLTEVRENEPVYLTKNGRGAYVIISIEEYEQFERFRASVELYGEIKKALDVDEKEGLLTEEEAKKAVGLK